MFAGMDTGKLIFFFFLFSFFGWIFGLFLEILAGRGFVNRGFFYGPVVPIYAAVEYFTGDPPDIPAVSASRKNSGAQNRAAYSRLVFRVQQRIAYRPVGSA
jgi:hypothetical protein